MTGRHAVNGRKEIDCVRHWEDILYTCQTLFEDEAKAFIAKRSSEEHKTAKKVFTYPAVDPGLWLWMVGEFDLDKIVQYYHERK